MPSSVKLNRFNNAYLRGLTVKKTGFESWTGQKIIKNYRRALMEFVNNYHLLFDSMFSYAFVCCFSLYQFSYSIVANLPLEYSRLMPVLICMLYLVSM